MQAITEPVATGTQATTRPVTLGVIVGNRDFFPDSLIAGARAAITRLFGELGLSLVMVDERATKLGAVETYADAAKCAALFRENAARIDGLLVALPNFGDEKAVVDTLRASGLQVPILVQAEPDDLDRLDVARRRDAFCGKISVCNNLRQYGYAFSLTRRHTVGLADPEFRADLEWFAAVCRVVRGLRRARLGALGARPAAFNTVRFSEKILERAGISVVTADLSSVFGEAQRLAADDPRIAAKAAAITGYADASRLPDQKLQLTARLAVAVESWCEENAVDATAVQCWDSIQANYGINSCTVMSMLSESLRPSACETDVTGALSMYALQLASGRPSALVDWNNNYGGEADRCVLFHCGNWPVTYAPKATIGTAPILGTTLGEERTWGTINGRTPAGPCTFARIGTDDTAGKIRAYVGEGRFTDDPLGTFGCRAVVEVPALQSLLRHICREGFEHHAAVNGAGVASAVDEALGRYLGWDCYRHGGARD
ncbi:MAG: L-fucose/L-arabinose isomerase family protein [Vicinamibacteria bacterium]